MEINLNNYEAFFLDYYEGKLNRKQTEELFQFLEQHPELQEEFNSFKNITLENEAVLFKDKNSLIKPEVTHRNYENYLIAEAEGDLSVNEKRALSNFLIQHPDYDKDRNLYSKVKVIPDETVVFSLKEKLKKVEEKPVAKVIYLYRSMAVAASIVIAFFIFIQINKTKVSQPVAEIKNEIKTEAKEENKEKVNPVRVTPEDNSTVEVKNNFAEVKEKKQAKIIKTAANNILAKEEIKNLQTAFTIPEKIEPAVTGKANELPEAPVLEVAEKTQLPEEKTEVSEISQPTLAQAAINTVEKIFSGDPQLNEANVASSVVELAANGLNKLTGKELVSFERKCNEEGQLKKIQIAAGNFGISRTKSR